jgi:SAGA-associated factor 29
MNLLDSLNILAGLKEASEATEAQSQPLNVAPPQRTATGKLGRASKKGAASKASAAAADDIDDVPAAPSPKIHLGPSRLAKDKPSRAGSVSATREASVKLEDGAESVASSADGVSTATGPTASTTATAPSKAGAGRPSNRLVLTKGEIVFCRHSQSQVNSTDPPEGEGILCRVTAVIGEGKQRRYEVQDADTSTDPPPQSQRASVSQLMQIPERNTGLHELMKGRNVIAQYPDTTTFYKAEVVEAWKGGEAEVRLKFEDDEVARDVERRFVLTEK